MSDMCRKFRVTGRVQGVWFRAWTQRTAEELGLRGWVRNEDDGSVSGVAAGPEDAVARFLEALKHGPERAVVAEVETEASGEDAGDGFRVAP
ncbi:acylphosphatase [Psychromarinibacter sp. C21-152]|uniref:Acylphosphatase n=1 Tax=Psychromarinibacter sediminicola TaxID=3033385 RepID=A0AAE3TA90_9RHOB|nr:acylphosphatase [Psychromarinibacter sediminicola]MDF0601749.1 acylphosphatase [Psychromarinibacter sediminicola]